jgi:hypothetical protein
LAPEYVETIESILKDRSDVGIVSPWHHEDGGVRATLPPAFPYQWVWNDVSACAAFRIAAVDEAGAMRTMLADSYAMWDLCNAILALGWRAAPFPAVLASRAQSAPPDLDAAGRAIVSYESILSRFPELFAPDAVEVAVLQRIAEGHLHESREPGGGMRPAATHTMSLRDVIRATPEQRRALVERAISDPSHVARWLGWQGQHLVASARAAFRRPR